MRCAATPCDPEPNGDPAGSHRQVHPGSYNGFVARHGPCSEPACSRRWAAQRPLAILIRTAILPARIASCTLAPTMDLWGATEPVASRRAAGDGLRSGPGDSDPNGDPAGCIASCTLAPTNGFVARHGPCSEPAMGCAAAPCDSEPNGDSVSDSGLAVGFQFAHQAFKFQRCGGQGTAAAFDKADVAQYHGLHQRHATQ